MITYNHVRMILYSLNKRYQQNGIRTTPGWLNYDFILIVG